MQRTRTGSIVKHAGVILLLGLFPASLLAQAANEWRGPEHLYNSTCGYCHELGVGPVLKGRGLPVEYIRLRLRAGFRAMPAFKPSEISEADATSLARWLSAPAKKGRDR